MTREARLEETRLKKLHGEEAKYYLKWYNMGKKRGVSECLSALEKELEALRNPKDYSVNFGREIYNEAIDAALARVRAIECSGSETPTEPRQRSSSSTILAS